jgi:hypothetical protein
METGSMISLGDPEAEKQIESAVRQVVEAMTPSADRLSKKVAALMGEFNDELQLNLQEAAVVLARQKAVHAMVSLPELTSTLIRSAMASCARVPRPITGGELLDIIEGRRHLPWTGPAQPDWRERPSKGERGKGGGHISRISAEVRLAKLLKSLGVFSDENLQRGLDWGINFSFPVLRDMDKTVRRAILQGKYVHTGSVLITEEETSGPKLLTYPGTCQTQPEAKPESEPDRTGAVIPTTSPGTSPPVQKPVQKPPQQPSETAATSRKRGGKPRNGGKNGDSAESTYQHPLPLNS